MFEQGRISAFEDAKLFLDTLEVKEVNLEEEIKKYIKDNICGYCVPGTEESAKYFFELGLKAKKEQKVIKQDNKDLCKTCKHYWQDFPLPLESVVSHCEILDSKKGLSANINSEVSYPCLKCPFNSYIKNEKL